MNNPYKNGAGKYLTKGLFWEYRDILNPQCIYTLKRQDHMSYPSLYRLYMECTDPTEYEFATKHLDGWIHWKELQESPFFQPHLLEWRDEYEVRTKALALANIQDISAGQSPAKLAANKLLLEGGWQPKDKRKVGRPMKEKIIDTAGAMTSEELDLLNSARLQ